MAVAITDDAEKIIYVRVQQMMLYRMNGGTQGGDKFSYLEITALATAEYMVQGVLIGSGSVATPFADS